MEPEEGRKSNVYYNYPKISWLIDPWEFRKADGPEKCGLYLKSNVTLPNITISNQLQNTNNKHVSFILPKSY